MLYVPIWMGDVDRRCTISPTGSGLDGIVSNSPNEDDTHPCKMAVLPSGNLDPRRAYRPSRVTVNLCRPHSPPRQLSAQCSNPLGRSTKSSRGIPDVSGARLMTWPYPPVRMVSSAAAENALSSPAATLLMRRSRRCVRNPPQPTHEPAPGHLLVRLWRRTSDRPRATHSFSTTRSLPRSVRHHQPPMTARRNWLSDSCSP